jgi:hypothetical protein
MTLAISPTFAGPAVTEYRGVCEASAGSYIDSAHFLVASDETNVLRLYKRGSSVPVRTVDLQGFTGFDKSDLEGAAKIGDRVYWISSHSLTRTGKDQHKRRIFFATKTALVDGTFRTEGVGKPIANLRDGLASAAQVAPQDLNVEGLAATPDGGLLIGLRGPLRGANAIVIPMKNPAEVIEGGSPVWGPALEVDLAGRGIRSMETLPGSNESYLILAGPLKDSDEEFKVYKWSASKKKADPLDHIDLKGMKPEGLMQIPGTKKWHLLSDDDDVCSDEKDPKSARRFRSIELDVD